MRLVAVKPGDMEINLSLKGLMMSWVLEVEQKEYFLQTLSWLRKYNVLQPIKQFGI